MIMNVPAAPDMQGTPMTPDLSGQMQPEMGEVSQAEMQEAQGALMQIIQVINMLVQQGLNEDQIMEFLAQYGITEEELDQAAQLLGVDIDALIGGQMEQPQEPMMMAEGGPSVNYMDIYNTYKDVDFASMDDIRRPGTPEDYESKMFKIAKSLMISDFDYKQDLEAGRNDSAAERLVFIDNMKKELQMLKNEYDNLFNPKSKKQNMIPPMMMSNGGGASTSIDPSYIPEYLQMLENKQAELFNLTRKAPGINPTGLSPDMSLAQNRQQFETAKRDLRQATRALNPEIFKIYEAGQFRKLPTIYSKGVIEDYINFVNQKKN